MTKRSTIALALGLAASVAACDQAPPTAPEAPSPSMALVSTPGVVSAPIEGTFLSTGNVGPEDVLVTPSGQCQFREYDNTGEFTGSLSGDVVFERRIMNVSSLCLGQLPEGPGDPLNFSGPVHGTVTYDGRTGAVEGQGHGHCDYDPASPALFSCGGVYNLRGSGELAGVTFHVRWGPGWFPFPYEGTATSH